MKKRLQVIIKIAGFFLFFSATISKADNEARTNFLSDGPSSVGGSLGGAITAYPEDSSAVYWNPAGLVGQNSSIFVDHQNTNDNAATSWLGFAGGNPLLKFGLNWKHGQLPLDSSKDAILLGLGIDQSVIPWVPRLPGLSFGTTLGRVSEKISGTSASTYLLDVGALWRDEIGPWGVAAGGVIKNLYFGGLSFEGGSEKEKWPQELRGGLAANRWGVTGLIDIRAVDSNTRMLYGLEYKFARFVSLRVGYDNDISYGLGVKYKDLGLAFGYQTGEIQNKPSGSVSYTWGPKEEVDYTNPLSELEARHANLEAFLLAEVRSDVQEGIKLDLKKVLKLLAVAPQNDDAWGLLGSLTGESRFRAGIPRSSRSRRDYLAFAVAFADGNAEAEMNAQIFLKKYPRSSASKIIRLIQKYIPDLQSKSLEGNR